MDFNDMSTLTAFHCIVIAHQTTKLIAFNKSTSLVYVLRNQKNGVRKLSWRCLWFYCKRDCLYFCTVMDIEVLLYFFSASEQSNHSVAQIV